MVKSKLYKINPVTYVLLGFFSIVFLVPMYMAVITAFKNPGEISLLTAWVPPLVPDIGSFVSAVREILPNFANSLILASCATVFAAIIGAFNGFVFSKKQFKGSDVIFTLFIFGMFIP
jgi:glucose/mannose transport system permease protein